MVTVHYRRWCPPKSPLQIEFHAQLLDEVRREGIRPAPSSAARWIPPRWMPRVERAVNESSGLLFGVRQRNEVRVLAARGEGEGMDPSGLAPVGIFVCRARGEVFLTEDDLVNFEKHRGLLALVIAGGQAGFFVREPDGSVQAIRSHEEFPVDAAPPAVSKSVPKPESKKSPAAERPIPAPRGWPAWMRMAACAGILAVPAGAFAFLRPLLNLPIALALREDAGQLVIGWNPDALRDGSRLEILDGSERTILMLPAHSSSATYGPQGSDVEVRITADTRAGGARWEAARFITRASPQPPPALGAAQKRVAALQREAQALRRSLVRRQARTSELMARMDELTATPER